MQAALDAALFGDPDACRVERQSRQWRSHFSEMNADPSVAPVTVATEVIRSTFGHALWRLTAGPPTTVGPGALITLLGFVALLLAATPVSSLDGASAFSGFFAVIGGVLLAGEARPDDRSLLTRATWALIVLGLSAAVTDYLLNPVIPGDHLAALGTFVAGASVAPHVTKRRSTTSWRRWAVTALGLAILATSNLQAASLVSDPAAAKLSSALFVLEGAAALALLKWSLARRATATNTPNQAVLTP